MSNQILISFFKGGIYQTRKNAEIDIKELVDMIRSGKYKNEIENIRKESDENKQDELKHRLDYVTLSGVFDERADANLKAHTGYVGLDIDNYNGDYSNLKKKISKIKFTEVVFFSPRNKIKIVVKIPPCEKNEHKDRFESACKFYARELGIPLEAFDLAVSEISRACFISYDPEVYYNPVAEVLDNIELKFQRKEQDAILDELKQKLSMEQVLISYGVNFDNKSGKKNRVHCPFHPPDNNSSMIFDQECFRCYHSNECKGDIFDFVMLYDKCDFPTAKAKLMHIAGITNHKNTEIKKSEEEDLDYAEKLATIKSLSTFLNDGIPDQKWRTDKILLETGVTIFGGAAGSFKTFYAMDLALSICSGKYFLGHFETKKGSVVYIDEENGDITMLNRFDKMKRGKQVDNVDLIHLSIFNNLVMDDPLGAGFLEAIINKFKPDVVILDSMVRMMSGEEDKAKDVKRIFKNIKPFLNRKIGFVILHHTTKADTKTMMGLRGSGDFSAFADVVLMFQGGKDGFCNVDIVKNRHIEIDDTCSFYSQLVTDTQGNISIEYRGQNDKRGDVNTRCAEQLWEWIQSEGFTNLDTAEIQKKVSLMSFQRNCGFNAIEILKKERKLIKLKRGNYKVNNEVQSSINNS